MLGRKKKQLTESSLQPWPFPTDLGVSGKPTWGICFFVPNKKRSAGYFFCKKERERERDCGLK
jgi:hypothetical protein